MTDRPATPTVNAMVFNKLWKRFMVALLVVAFAPMAYFGLQDLRMAQGSLTEEAVRQIFLNAMIRSKDIERAFLNAQVDIKNLRHGYAVTSLLAAARDRPEETVFWTELVERELMRFLANKGGYSAVGLLDEYGDEVVAVYRSGDRIAALENFRKRNHVTSSHFVEAAKQKGLGVAAITMRAIVPQDVKLSSVTLTRYATKVFDEKGVATGIIYLDLNGSEVLDGLSRISLENRRSAALVTHAGKYLFNPFMEKKATHSTLFAMEKENINVAYPRSVSRQILSGRAGIIYDDPKALFAYAAVFPEPEDRSRFFVVYDRYPRELMRPEAGVINRKYAMGAVGALALVALVAAALSHALTRHIRTLRKGVERFAHTREGSGKIIIRSGDEIEALAEAFNSMAESLSEYSLSLEKKVEERSLKIKEVERKLMEAEKMAAIGFLSAGVAHEINNPISVVVTRLELIRRAVDKGEIEKAKKDLEVVTHHALRVGRIAGNLLTFSRSKPGELSSVDLNEIVRRVLELLDYPVTKKGIALQAKLDEDIPFVWANAAGMEQVIYNIVFNAFQASEKGAVITVATIRNGTAMVDLRITDTGSGMSEDVMAHLFEPFFTTKEVGQGSGLGLSISYGLVKDFGGTISVESQPGAGASFTVSLRSAFEAMKNPTRGAIADA